MIMSEEKVTKLSREMNRLRGTSFQSIESLPTMPDTYYTSLEETCGWKRMRVFIIGSNLRTYADVEGESIRDEME